MAKRVGRGTTSYTQLRLQSQWIPADYLTIATYREKEEAEGEEVEDKM